MRRWLAVLPLAFAALPLAVVVAGAAAPSQGAPIHTRQSVFSIPFTIDPPEPGAAKPAEVQLHFRRDAGPWRLYGMAPPTQTSFAFRAPGDGRFGFMVRTIDERGQMQPGGEPQEELCVIVDTEPPSLDLHAQRGAAGTIVAQWRVADAYLLPRSLKVEYQLAGKETTWQTVAVDARGDVPTAAPQAGQATWVAGAPDDVVQIRASVADAAGNITHTQQRVESVGSAPGDRVAGPPDAWREHRTAPRGATSTRWPSEPASDPRNLGAPPPLGESFPGSPNDRRPPVQPAGDRDPSQRTAEVLPPPRETLENPIAETLPAPKPEGLATRDAAPRGRPSAEEIARPAPTREPRHGVLPRRKLEGDLDGPVFAPAESVSQSTPDGEPIEPRETVVEATPVEPTPVEPRDEQMLLGQSLPADAQLRMVGSQRFELEYDLESVGPAGIGKIELWITRNGGKSWSSYGVDGDNRSPFVVNVDGEGLYGFRIVVESGTGLGGTPPAAGDVPELWVGVDTTRPTAKLTTAELGEGSEAGELTIRWEASDARLAERPISLAYSATPGGPWSTIAARLENTRMYTWRIDSRVPDRVYLRLEARDEAGNTELYEARDPVSLDPVRPKGHLRGVRSIGESSARGPQWYYNLR